MIGLTVPALQHQTDRTIGLTLFLGYLETLVSRLLYYGVVSIALVHPVQETFNSERLLPILEICDQGILFAIPAKTDVVAVILLNYDFSVVGFALVASNGLGTSFPLGSNITQGGLEASQVTNLRFDLAKVRHSFSLTESKSRFTQKFAEKTCDEIVALKELPLAERRLNLCRCLLGDGLRKILRGWLLR